MKDNAAKKTQEALALNQEEKDLLNRLKRRTKKLVSTPPKLWFFV